MNIYAGILRVFSVALIVWGAVLALVGFTFIVVFSDSTMVSSTAQEYSTDPEFLQTVFLLSGFALIVGALIAMLTGLLGMRTASYPNRSRAFLILSGVVFALHIIALIVSVASGDEELAIVALALVATLITGLCFYCAYAMRKQAESDPSASIPVRTRIPLGSIMTVIQVLFALNIVIVLAYLTTLIKGNYELTFDDMLMLANLIFDAVSFLFIFNRFRFTRNWIMGFSAFNVVAGTAYNIACGQFMPLDQILASAFDIFLFFYFWKARTPKDVLVVEINTEFNELSVQENNALYQIKTWPFWRNMIIYFFIFGIVGHWMEAGLCLLIKYGIVPGIYDPTSQIWSDWLYPFPVYGVGMCACGLLLFPIKNKFQELFKRPFIALLLSFVVNALVCSGIELSLGLATNMPDENGVYPLWDYSDMFCNFMGQICLQNTVAFGLIATLMTWIVFPSLQKVLLRLPKDIGNAVFVGVTVFGLITYCLYIVNIVV